jgi:hypothetical protein
MSSQQKTSSKLDSSLIDILSQDSLSLVEIINATLVEYGGRPGTLIQHADYGEKSASGPLMKQKLKALKKLYPDLHHTWIGQGMLITKEPVSTDIEYWTTKHVGEALGYIEPVESLNVSHPYSIKIYVKLKETPQPVIITGMVATKLHKEGLKNLTAHYKKTLLKSPLFADKIDEVGSKVDEIINEETIIHKLINKEHISKKLDFEISNYLYNISMETFQLYDFKYKNPLHIGMLIALLLQHKYDPVSPFIPVNETNYSDQYNTFNAAYEDLLADFLDNNDLQKISPILNTLRNSPETLTETDKATLLKAISHWGKNDTIILKDFLTFPFIYINKIHVGIVATIFILKLRDPMKAFEPAQTPKKITAMENMYHSYESAIIRIASETNSLSSVHSTSKSSASSNSISSSSSNSYRHSKARTYSSSSECSGKHCKINLIPQQQGCTIQ